MTLYPTEREVQEHAGIHVGHNVRIRPEVLTGYRRAGIACDTMVGVARVLRIVKGPGWVSAELLFDNGRHGWQAPEELEP